MRLVYSVEALNDLIRLREFIAAYDPSAAARVAKELLARIEYLQAFPALGKRVLLAPDPGVVRDAVFGSYVVRYAILPGSLTVLRVWHHFENRGADI